MTFNPYAFEISFSGEDDQDVYGHIEIDVTNALHADAIEEHGLDWDLDQIELVRTWAAGILARVLAGYLMNRKSISFRCGAGSSCECSLYGDQIMHPMDDMGAEVCIAVTVPNAVAAERADELKSLLQTVLTGNGLGYEPQRFRSEAS